MASARDDSGGPSADHKVESAVPIEPEGIPASPEEAAAVRPLRSPSSVNNDSQHSLGGSSAGSGTGDKEVKSKDSTGKTSKVQKFRRKTWIMLLVSQVVLLMLIIAELALLSAFVKHSKKEMAESNVHLSEEMFSSKVHEMAKVLEITAESAQVQHLLVDGTQSNVDDQLRQQAAQLHFEYFAVVNAAGDVVASVPSTLVGYKYDPLSLVNEILAADEPTVLKKNAIVSGAGDLMVNDIVTWRESNIDGYVLKHPTDESTTSSALVRYVAAPIKDSAGNLVGALVAGDIATGKHLVAEKTLKELGAGFVLLVHKSSAEGSAWQISQTALATGFETFDTGFESVDESFFDKVIASGEATKLGVVVEQEKFAVAGKQIEVHSGQAVLIVGFPQTEVDIYFTDIIITTLLFTAACIIVDLVATFFSIRSFIDPLEKLVILISTKNLKKIDEALNNVKTSKNFIYRILLFSTVSTALFAGMFVRNSQLLHDIFVAEGAIGTQIRFLQNSFSYKIEEMISHATGESTSDNMSALLASPTPLLMSDIQNDLENVQSVFHIELAFVIDTNRTIISSAGGYNLNQVFSDLSDEISDVFRNRKGLQFTGFLSHEVYSSFGPPEWKDDSVESSLHPSRSNANVVVRFVLSPVIDSQDGVTMRGILVYGDILNGKGFEVPRDSVEFFHEGYAGVYWHDPEADEIKLLASYFYDTSSYDEGISSKTALERVKQRRETALENGVEVVDEKISIAVERIDPGFEFDVYSDSRKRTAKHDQVVFLVRGTEYAAFKSMERSQLALEVTSIILNFLFSIGVAVYTFVPIYKFSLRLKMQLTSKRRPSALADVGFLDGAKGAVGSMFRSFTQRSSRGGSSRKDSVDK